MMPPTPLSTVAKLLDLDSHRVAFAHEMSRLAIERFFTTKREESEEYLTLFILLCALFKNEENGSTLLPFASIPELLAPLTTDPSLVERLPNLADLTAALAAGRIDTLLASQFCSQGELDAYTPLLAFSDGVTLQRLAFQERRIVAGLADRLRLNAQHLVDSLSTDLGGGRWLNHEQTEAVRRAIALPVSLVSGGPGTGKTSIVAALVRALLEQKFDPSSIALTAPTGKAAHRLGSSVAKSLSQMGLSTQVITALPEASTLHRLLRYNPRADSFGHSSRNPLPAAVVIVDEASMIDLHIFERMLAALAPETKLVLLGDANQLPSVEAGSVFRDLMELPQLRDCVTGLTESFRMRASDSGKGRNILMVANDIVTGKKAKIGDQSRLDTSRDTICDPDSFIPVRSHPGEIVWNGVELLRMDADTKFMNSLLQDWLRELFEESRKDPTRLESRKILCFTRVGPFGSDAINQLLSRRFADLTRQTHRRFHSGEPVIVTENDYSRGIFNGDNGYIEPSRRAQGLDAVFPRAQGSEIRLPLQTVEQNLDHAFAITVHKSQGSEYERTLILLPNEETPFATRDLLYTALTRSSRSSVLVGSIDVLHQVAARKLRRHSTLARMATDADTPQKEEIK